MDANGGARVSGQVTGRASKIIETTRQGQRRYPEHRVQLPVLPPGAGIPPPLSIRLASFSHLFISLTAPRPSFWISRQTWIRARLRRQRVHHHDAVPGGFQCAFQIDGHRLNSLDQQTG